MLFKSQDCKACCLVSSVADVSVHCTSF